MAHEHHRAIRASRWGLVAGAAGVLLVILLSVLYTKRLRSSLLTPMAALVSAAKRFGRGEFSTRVGRVGEGELQAVADACDHMALELQAREQRLIAAERMAVVGQFAAGVAHELNNPIGVIRGYLKTMKPSQPPEMLAEELQILDEEAAACQRIAEDLLEFARPKELARDHTRIDELLTTTVQRFIASGEARGHAVSVDAERAEGGLRAGHGLLNGVHRRARFGRWAHRGSDRAGSAVVPASRGLPSLETRARISIRLNRHRRPMCRPGSTPCRARR